MKMNTDYFMNSSNSGVRTSSFSPTSGRLHRQKESFSLGPTICLMSKSKVTEQIPPPDKGLLGSYLQKILLLTIQIARLQQIIKQSETQKTHTSKHSQQLAFLKEENDKLKISIQTQLIEKQKQSFKHETIQQNLKERINNFESENKNLSWRLKQFQRDMEELKRLKKQTQMQSERARMEMSMQFNNGAADLQKSIAKERKLEIQTLQNKVFRCEEVINDQKILISNQREQLNRLKSNDHETQNNLIHQIEELKHQLISQTKQQSSHYESQIKNLKMRIGQLQGRNKSLQNSLQNLNHEIRQKTNYIEQLQNVELNYKEMQDKCNQYERNLHDLQFVYHTEMVKNQQNFKLSLKNKQKQIIRLSHEKDSLTIEFNLLKQIIDDQKKLISLKDTEMNRIIDEYARKLQQKQTQMKRLQRKNFSTSIGSETKINRTISLQNIPLQNKIGGSSVDLQQIVSNVLQLKNSTERTNSLINRTFNSPRDYYYAH